MRGQHIAVIGGGIAGVSAAYHLARRERFDRVVLVEAERQLAMHTTGRSAAILTENYGAGPVRPLTGASLEFFHTPPIGLADDPLVHRRGMLTVATAERDYPEFEQQLAAGQRVTNPIVEMDHSDAAQLAPHIKFTAEHRAIWETEAHDIDVAALHQAYVRGFRRAGGEIATSHRVDSARRNVSSPSTRPWHLETSGGPLTVDTVVNAAGAWGDTVAKTAGIAPVGLQPLRRTAFMVRSNFADSAGYPMVAEVNHDWYVRPDGSQFLCSPADETLSEPCDAKPDELDVARTIDMVNNATNLAIRSVASQWAGLRTFAPDRAMVIGPEPTAPDFVWCVGQGGTGIQTSPAAGHLLADLVVDGEPSDHFDGCQLNINSLLPDRLR